MDTPESNKIKFAITLLVVFAIVLFIGLSSHRRSRHIHHTKLVKTKSHKVYAENEDGSSYIFVDSGGGADIDLPRSGSSSFKLPKGTWVRSNPPREEEVEEEEQAEIEESDTGQPEADAEGDVGADSDGAAPANSGSDSGGDGGGDGGGGDGGGGDGG
jgi:hypothetical protein